jgi:hypothetical protein
VESVDQKWKEVVKDREQRRSRKDRRRSRLGTVSDSEDPNPTSASGVEQTRKLLRTECLPRGCENLGADGGAVGNALVTSGDDGAEREET